LPASVTNQVLSGPGDDTVDGGAGDDFIALAVGIGASVRLASMSRWSAT
jgi:hypothetical protein